MKEVSEQPLDPEYAKSVMHDFARDLILALEMTTIGVTNQQLENLMGQLFDKAIELMRQEPFKTIQFGDQNKSE